MFFHVLLVLSTISCTGASKDQDWQIYMEIIEKPEAETKDLSRCRAFKDPSLAGDCALAVVVRLARQEGSAIENRCTEVPEGIWREECHFVAAERARSAGKVDLAIGLCEQAGAFAQDCAFHLWQRAMRTLAQRIKLETLAEQQPLMRSVHARWSKRVGHFSDFDAIFWRKLFRAIWDGVYLIDPNICVPLDPDLHRQCLLGARIHLDHVLRASLREPEWTQNFCQAATPPVSALQTLPGGFPELDRFPDHPAHQSVVDAFHQAACVNGSLPDHPDPPRRKMTQPELKAIEVQERTVPATQSK